MKKGQKWGKGGKEENIERKQGKGEERWRE